MDSVFINLPSKLNDSSCWLMRTLENYAYAKEECNDVLLERPIVR
jgi:hypothetical protein